MHEEIDEMRYGFLREDKSMSNLSTHLPISCLRQAIVFGIKLAQMRAVSGLLFQDKSVFFKVDFMLLGHLAQSDDRFGLFLVGHQRRDVVCIRTALDKALHN